MKKVVLMAIVLCGTIAVSVGMKSQPKSEKLGKEWRIMPCDGGTYCGYVLPPAGGLPCDPLTYSPSC